jgi:hypothetical protein
MALHHRESAARIDAPPHEVFAFIDDHARFSSHMSKSSWMMGGGRMSIDLDAAKGQAVGSHIRFSGTVFGIRLSLDEVVTRRSPPTDKVWETVGAPRLLVIGSYTMGIQITPENGGSHLRVFLDYGVPCRWATRWLGLLFAGLYARWCVEQMIAGASKHFNRHQAVAAA